MTNFALTTVSSGSTVSGVVISGPDQQAVLSGGTTISIEVASGGLQSVYYGGVASSTLVDSAGSQLVLGGSATSTEVLAGGNQTVSILGVASGTVLSGAATQSVVSSGTTSDTVINAGAIQTASAGGVAFGSIVYSAGILQDGNGGQVNGAQALSGGVIAVQRGGSDFGSTISTGGTEVISGGSTEEVSILSGGTQTVLSNGYGDYGVVHSGGTQTVSSGGYAEDDTLSGGLQLISTGGSSYYVGVASGGVQDVLAGGSATGTTVSAGGAVQVQSGGETTNASIEGGIQTVFAGGSALRSFVYSGTELVSSGGSAQSAVLRGGLEQIAAGGTASNLFISAGTEQIMSGGLDTASVVSGGVQDVLSGGVASSTAVFNGTQRIEAGGMVGGANVAQGVQIVIGTASGALLYDNGIQQVSGGVASATTIQNNAEQYVSSGGTASGNTVYSGASDNIDSLGVANGTTLSGGAEFVFSGGVANGTLVLTSGRQVVLGSAVGTTISAGGSQTVSGTALGTIISAGGVEILVAGGKTSASIINAGGQETVSGGLATSGTVGAQGVLVVSAGTASGSLVTSGGTLLVSSGFANGGTIAVGGLQTVIGAGIASGTLVSGGAETVVDGGTDTGASVLSGGVMTVQSGGVAASTLVGTDGTQNISSGGVASGVAVSAGMQNVNSGGVAVGATMQAGGMQVVQSGGVASASIIASVGTQEVSSGGNAYAASISSGGTQIVFAGGTAFSTTVSAGGAAEVVSGGTLSGAVLSAGGSLYNDGTVSATSGAAVSGTGGDAIIFNQGAIVGAGLGGIAITTDGGTITNGGTLIGLGGTAVALGGTGTNRLIVTSASVISGVVSASAQASNTLELSGGGTAVLSGFDANYVGFQAVQVDGGSQWEVAGASTLSAMNGDGTLLVNTGDTTTITGTLGLAAGSGTVAVSGTGTLVLGDAVASGQSVALSGNNATLMLDDPNGFAGTLSGLARGDVIDLRSAAPGTTSASLSGSTIQLTDSAGSGSIALDAPVAGSALVAVSDGQGGTDLMLLPPVTEALASDTGISASDQITSNDTLTGNADPNAVVTLTEGANTLGTATADNTGVWSFSPAGLADGPHSIVAAQTDAGGHTGTANLAFTLSTVAPTPTLSLAPGSDSGNLGDNITDATTPTLTGLGAAGDAITLSDGGVGIGTATVGNDGTWSITPSAALSDGTHSLSALETDTAGNTGSAGLNLTIDTAIPPTPAAPVLDPASDSGLQGDDLTGVTRPAFDGTGATADDIITLLDSGTAIGTALVANGGAWSVTPAVALADGLHHFTVTDTSAAGETSQASAALGVTIDTTLPAIPGVPVLAVGSDSGVAGDDLTNITMPVIDGTGGGAGDTVTLFDGTTVIGSTVAGSDGAWSVTPTAALADGTHSLTATDTNLPGNSSAASPALTLTIDTVPPAANLALAMGSDTGLAGDNLTDIANPTLTGTGTAGDTITLSDNNVAIGATTIGGSGVWSVTPALALADGAHPLSVSETDPAGNVGTATLSVTIDTHIPTTPLVPVLDPASDSGVAGDELTNIAAPTFDGTGGGVGDTITLLDGTTAIGSATVLADGIWSVTPGTPLIDGTHLFSVTDTSVAGEVSPASGSLSVVIDTVAPTPGLALAAGSDTGLAGDNLTDIARPTLTGAGTAGDSVTLLDDGVVIATTTVGAAGTWSATPATALADGAHPLSVQETDPAGNVGTAGLAITIDTHVPGAPSAPVLAVGSDSGVVGDNRTDVLTPTLGGTGGGAGDTITLFNGTHAIGSATVAGDGTWSVSPASALADGTHTLTATDTSVAGEISAISAATMLTIAPSTLSLAPGSDSGVAGDRITNIDQPTILGTGVAGDHVILYDNSTAIGSATVAIDDSWSITTGALANGAHDLTAVRTDANDQTTGSTTGLALTVVTTPPAPPAGLALVAASDSGVLGDRITDIAAPTITGTGAAGATVTLYDGTTDIGSATVGANGAWAAVTTLLADGSHNLTAKQTDVAGNVSTASTGFVLDIDTATPTPPASLGLAASSDSGARGDNVTNIAAPTLTGTGSAGDTITLYDGTAVIGSAVVGGNGAWSAASSLLADGMRALSATQTDPAGKVSAHGATLSLAIDTVAPAAPVLANTSISSNRAAPAVSGSAVAGSTVMLYDGAVAIGSARADVNGGWALSLSGALSAGTHSLTAKAVDVAGNLSSASNSLSVQVAASGAYGVSTPDGSGTVTRNYDATGMLTSIDTEDAAGRLIVSVGNTSATHEIYDNAGTLIGSITQPNSDATANPVFDVTAGRLSATSATNNTASMVNLLGEANTLTTCGDDTVTAGSGSARIYAAGPTISVTGGSGDLMFVGGAGSSTVTGGSGHATIYGGAGGGFLQGGTAGGGILVAGGGNTTLVGGGSADHLVAGAGSTTEIMQSGETGYGGAGNTTIYGGANGVLIGGPGHTVMVARDGAEALWAGTGSDALYAGSGADTMIGGAGPGITTMQGGTGNDEFVGSSGNSAAFGGTGNDMFFTGSGAMTVIEGNGNDRVTFGNGAATAYGGKGHDLYDFANGTAGGNDVIGGFKVGTDQIALYGYGPNAVQTQSSGGNLTLDLSDGTRITLLGITHLTNGSLV